MQADFPIDFVVTWVNNHDEDWQRKKAKYERKQPESRQNDEIAQNRYRDFGLFKYWFRSIEQNASWVHKIYIVTDNFYQLLIPIPLIGIYLRFQDSANILSILTTIFLSISRFNQKISSQKMVKHVIRLANPLLCRLKDTIIRW